MFLSETGLPHRFQKNLGPATFIIAFWWLFGLVLAATYSGNLVAFLTVEKIHTPFKSLDELASQDNYHFGTLSGTAFMDLLKVCDLPFQ